MVNGLKSDLSTLYSVSEVYQKKQLEYRQDCEFKLANIDDLIAETKVLSSAVFDLVSYRGN